MERMYNDWENIEWINIWHEKANMNEAIRIALVGDSVTRGIRGRFRNYIREGDSCGFVCIISANSRFVLDETIIASITLSN